VTITPAFLDFFTRCIAEGRADILLQGGRRSGKTFATFQFIDAVGRTVGGLNVLVVCGSYPQLQSTMQDFTDCIGASVKGNVVNGYSAMTGLHTLWQFRNIDAKEKAQGVKCDIMFVNEAVNVAQEVIETLAVGVRWFKVYNFNPTKKGFIQSLIQADGGNLMLTTWASNPHLTPEQLQEFERMKERAQRPTATRHDEYMYRVYYCGEFSDMAGAVFGTVERVTTDHYREIPATEVYGVDFGFALDGDPTTMVGCKVWQKCAYFHEYIYERGLTNDEDLARRMVAAGVDRHSLIFGDYGGAGKGRMYTLITADNGKWEGDIAGGIPMQNAVKGTILDGLSQMLSMDAIYVTDTSTNLRDEMEGYELDDSGKPHGADHAIDAARYALTYAKNYL